MWCAGRNLPKADISRRWNVRTIWWSTSVRLYTRCQLNHFSPWPGSEAGHGEGCNLHREPRTNLLPSQSSNSADVPQSSFFGGCTNFTPLAESWRYVASTSSQANEPLKNEPTRSSWPCGVKSTRPVVELLMPSSIQRWPGPIG